MSTSLIDLTPYTIYTPMTHGLTHFSQDFLTVPIGPLRPLQYLILQAPSGDRRMILYSAKVDILSPVTTQANNFQLWLITNTGEILTHLGGRYIPTTETPLNQQALEWHSPIESIGLIMPNNSYLAVSNEQGTVGTEFIITGVYGG